MCVPPQTLQLISMGMTAAGTAVQIGATRAQARAAKSQYDYEAILNEYNAAIAQMQAEDASRRGFLEETELRRQAEALKGTQRATMAASGIDISSGSPLDILMDTAYGSELDAAAIRRNAYMERLGFETQAQSYRSQAKLSRMAGENALRAGRLGTWTTLLTGLGSLADQWYVYQQRYPRQKKTSIGG